MSVAPWTGLQGAGGLAGAVPSGPVAPLEDSSSARMIQPGGGVSLLSLCGQLSRAGLLVLERDPAEGWGPWGSSGGRGLLWGSGVRARWAGPGPSMEGVALWGHLILLSDRRVHPASAQGQEGPKKA